MLVKSGFNVYDGPAEGRDQHPIVRTVMVPGRRPGSRLFGAAAGLTGMVRRKFSVRSALDGWRLPREIKSASDVWSYGSAHLG